MSYAKNTQLSGCCSYPGLTTRTAYDQQMQKVYCPLAQKAYRSPETLSFEPYVSPNQTNQLTRPTPDFYKLKNAYGMHTTFPIAESFNPGWLL